ncbi:MAG: PBP1 and LysM peptidoglycan-binding domain-containing protein [Bacteroidota bacterium]
MKRIFGLMIILVLAIVTYAQQESPEIQISDEKITLNGEKFYLHTVESGQTLFSISKAYNVEQKELMVHNPDITGGLKTGMTIKIPVRSLKKQESPDIDSTEYHVIRIRRKHTLYSLSKRYDVTIQEIYEANPGLETRGLQRKDTILIPKHALMEDKVDFSDPEFTRDSSKFIYHKVKAGETLYRIGKKYNVEIDVITNANPDLKTRDIWVGEVIKIPREQVSFVVTFPEADEHVQADTKPDTSAAYDIIPMDIFIQDSLPKFVFTDTIQKSDIETLDVLLMLPFNVKDNLDYLKSREDEDKDPKIHAYAENMLQFYEGFLLGLEQLDSIAGNIKLNVRDTEGSEEKTKAILNGFETPPDLIIGPVRQKNTEITLHYADTNNINVVASVDPKEEKMFKHKSLINIQANMEVQWHFIAEYLLEHQFPVLIIHDELPASISYAKKIENNIKAYYDAHGEPDFLDVSTMAFDRTDKENMEEKLNNEDTTFVISASSDKVFITSLMNALYQCDENEIILLGEQKWLQQQYVELEEYRALRFAYVSSSYINYTDSTNHSVIKQFREDFYDEPGSYAFKAYDISNIIIPVALEYGRNLNLALAAAENITGHSMNFRFPYKGNNMPLINVSLKLIGLQDDYSFTILFEQ